MEFDSVADCVGKVISEAPYVKILSMPKQQSDGSWTAVAQVNEVLALVALSVKRANG